MSGINISITHYKEIRLDVCVLVSKSPAEMWGFLFILNQIIMPTVIIPDKVCSHCGGNRYIIEKEKKPSKSNPDYTRTRYRCVVKSKERSYRWAANNPDRVKTYQKPKPDGYYRTPKMKERYRLKSKRESEQLTDNFVKNILLGKYRHR